MDGIRQVYAKYIGNYLLRVRVKAKAVSMSS